MRRSTIVASIAAGMLISSYVAVDAQQPRQRVQVGVLECRGGASVGFIVGSVTNLGCVLHVEGRPEDRYIAVIQKVGLDIGVINARALEGTGFRTHQEAEVRLNAPALRAAVEEEAGEEAAGELETAGATE